MDHEAQMDTPGGSVQPYNRWGSGGDDRGDRPDLEQVEEALAFYDRAEPVSPDGPFEQVWAAARAWVEEEKGGIKAHPDVVKEGVFQYELLDSTTMIRMKIQECEGQHVQQAIFSTFMDTLTQICFTEQKVRSTIAWEGNRSWKVEH